MLTLNCDTVHTNTRTDTRTDEHSDCGSDLENPSHIVDYRMDANISITMPTTGRGIRRDYDTHASDDSSCDGDTELSPTPAGKRFKSEVEDDDSISGHAFSKGKFRREL